MMKFIEMQILDTFFFKDGRTVFVGYLDEPVDYIKAGTAEICVGDVVKAKIAIEDEMLPLQHKDKSKRSISTFAPLDAGLRNLTPKKMKLRIHNYGRKVVSHML